MTDERLFRSAHQHLVPMLAVVVALLLARLAVLVLLQPMPLLCFGVGMQASSNMPAGIALTPRRARVAKGEKYLKRLRE